VTESLIVTEVTPRGVPWTGGVETHVHNLSQAMQTHGVRVQVLTHTTEYGENNRMPGEGGDEHVDGVRYRRFRLPLRGLWEMPNWRLLREVRRLARKSTVVHVHSFHQPLAFLTAVSLVGVRVPLIFTPYYHGTGHTRLAAWLHKVWRPTAGKLLMRRADAIIAISEPEADLLIQHFPFAQDRVHVIPSGIVPPAHSPGAAVSGAEQNTDRTLVLSVGRLAPYKRNDSVIDAIARAPISVSLVLVGEGPDRARLEALAHSLGVADRVLFAGRVDDDELAAWWSKADVFVSMSEQESFGLALGEALAAGVPAVVSGIPAFRYVADLASARGAPEGSVQIANEVGLPKAITRPGPRFAPVNVMPWADVAHTTRNLFVHLRK